MRQLLTMKDEWSRISPVGLEYEMYLSIMSEVADITARLQRFSEA